MCLHMYLILMILFLDLQYCSKRTELPPLSFSICYNMRVVSTFLEEKLKRALLIVMDTHDEVY